MGSLGGPTVRGFLRATALLTVASAAAGVGNFGFNVLVARQGGPTAYGAVAPLLAVAAIATVLMTATTFAVARMVVSEGPTPRRALRRSARALAPWLAIAAALLVFAQPLAAYLHLGGPGLVTFAVLFGVAGIAGGAPLGVLLGMRRFGWMAAVMLTMPVSRIAALEVLLGVMPATDAALVASILAAVVTLATAVAAVVWLPAAAGSNEPSAPDSLAQESVVGSLLAGGLWVLWALPVAVSRHVLSPAAAGDLAAVQLMATGVIYLTSPVVTVFFPLIARDGTGRAARTGLLATLGVAATAGLALALLGPAVTPRLYGAAFAPPGLLFGVFGASAIVIAAATYGLWAGRAARRFMRLAAVVVTLAIATELALSVVLGAHTLALAALPAAGLGAALLLTAAGLMLHHQARHLGEAGPSPACLACLALRA